MRYFDLHCDTLFKAVNDKRGINNPSYEVTLDKGRVFDEWTQCMAIWIPDELDCSSQMELFCNGAKFLKDECAKLNISDKNSDNNVRFLFTVENGSFLNNDIRNIELLKKHGVRMLTLTWNAENCIGGGADVQGVGLSLFGAECIKTLEENSIVVDVSHASDKMFFDVAERATKPFVASHSNSRSICPHRRNLTNEQFEIIKNKGGIVGLNFHRDFLSTYPEKTSITDVIKHTEHFLSLGGENVLSIGSDFDGSNPPQSLKGIEKIPVLYEELLKIGYTEQLVQKIMYYNAHNFFSRF